MADAALGAINLTVADLDHARAFYEQTIGLKALDRSAEGVRLGADRAPVVALTGDPAAPARARGTTGLFHLAILLPSRVELARALRRIADSGWRLGGASDHLVSEALYLSDPEGNGIEIYRDRPREEWPFEDGKLQMATMPLDIEGLLGELEHAEGGPNGAGAETRLGHVHLQVADLDDAAGFYRDLLGFEVTVEHYQGALFLSSGGYHHHIGLNTWAGEGAPPPPPGARGLRWFEIVFATAQELEGVAGRLRDAGVEVEPGEAGLRAADPSGNGVVLRAAA